MVPMISVSEIPKLELDDIQKDCLEWDLELDAFQILGRVLSLPARIYVQGARE